MTDLTQAGERLVHDPEGLNSGALPETADGLRTPLARFFTRSHAAVPALEVAGYALDVDGLVRTPRRFSVAELSRELPERRLTATLVCAGMRRSEFLSLGPLPGELAWGPE